MKSPVATGTERRIEKSHKCKKPTQRTSDEGTAYWKAHSEKEWRRLEMKWKYGKRIPPGKKWSIWKKEFHRLGILTLGIKEGLEFRGLRELSVNWHSTKPHLTRIVIKWIWRASPDRMNTGMELNRQWMSTMMLNLRCIVMVPTIWSQWMGDGSQNWRYE